MSHVRPWIWIRFWNEDAAADGDAYSIRPHAVHASLLPDIVADIHQRYPGFTIMNIEKAYPDLERRPEENNPHAITDLTMDVGGMWISGQPIETFHLGELAVEIASDHVSSVLSALKRCTFRETDRGTRFTKLHLWSGTTVLDDHQHHVLTTQLDNRKHEAEGRARDYFDKREQRERIAAVDKVVKRFN